MNRPSLFVRIRALLHAVARSIRHARAAGLGLAQIVRKAVNCIRLGPRGFARHVMAYDQLAQMDTRESYRAPAMDPSNTTGAELSAYERWLQQHEPTVATLIDGPLISVIMPTCNTPESFLREVIASVLAQTYLNWELCICDDASDVPHVHRILADVGNGDPRISVMYREQRGGIASATNDALKLATGEYVAPLDHDDLLHPDALASVAAALKQADADIVYTDHDCVGEYGSRRLPYFKPDWSLDLFLSQMYLGHLVVFRRDMVDRLGGLRPEMDGSQDYDLVLRCLADGAKIAHVPRVLYHWRQHSGSTSANADSKPYAHEAGRRAIQSYLDRVYPGAQAKDGAYTFCYDVRYNLMADHQPLASIVIPTRDRVDLLDICVRTLREQTEYKQYEILVVDNGSVELETMQWFDRMSREANIRVLPADIPFNWSALNNLAAREARGKVLVFLNNDTEIIDGQWLERLVDVALRPDVGVCGPLLLYGDMTIQHAGVVVGMGGWADHVFKGLPASHVQNCFASPVMRRNVLAVTGACMAIEKAKFDALGGFDESFIICGSDVEICLRAFHGGLLNVYVPEAKLVHHESKTRDPGNIPETDFVRSEQAYHPYRTAGDPYFNHNLDPMSCVPRPRNMP
ncbi:glycosyltransferase family 2 protein [Rhodanobacter terrae]|uniref:Glycosyltransferase family 2 protein n=1 Tax=Rhodanobacter terrae TaxID=418647 RepID=A0ABW0SZY7_9GAMM